MGAIHSAASRHTEAGTVFGGTTLPMAVLPSIVRIWGFPKIRGPIFGSP